MPAKNSDPTSHPGNSTSSHKGLRIKVLVHLLLRSFCPEVYTATLKLLERLGCDVDYPLDQNSWSYRLVNACENANVVAILQLVIDRCANYEAFVALSGSYVHQCTR